jgi:hypothetical protein
MTAFLDAQSESRVERGLKLKSGANGANGVHGANGHTTKQEGEQQKVNGSHNGA